MYNDNKVIDLFGGESMERNHLVNIGEQRFEKIRERKAFYIDKSNFIREWWDTGTTVTLITRPRRFGKTLNMSMLECFFQIDLKAEVTYLRGFPFGMRKNTGSCRVHFQ